MNSFLGLKPYYFPGQRELKGTYLNIKLLKSSWADPETVIRKNSQTNNFPNLGFFVNLIVTSNK